MLSLLFALIGLFVGGLINVLADDLPARVSPQRPHCPRCGHTHAPTGLLAVARVLFHGGRCPECDLPTRKRALAVELGTAVVFALLPIFTPEFPNLAIDALYFAVLILIIVIDMEHRLILHIVTFPTTIAAIALSSLQFGENSLVLSAVGAVLGFVLFYAAYWVGQLLYGPGALGFGDVTLSMTMGAMLGAHLIIFALILGVLIGGVTSLVLILTGVLTRHSRIPYGEFLAAAAMIMLLWGPAILEWYFA